MLLGNPLDSSMLKQQRRILRMLKVQLKETQRPKRRISSNSKTLTLRVIHQPSLRQVRVVLDLQGRRPNTRIPQQIHQQLRAEVAHANAAGELLVDQRLHRRPRLVDGRVGQLDLTVGCCPAGRVAHAGVQVLQCDWEVHDVQVEVVDAPVGELLAADWLDFVAFVEAVPEFGDDEEFFTLDEAIFDGAGYALSAFDFVAVVWSCC